MKTPSLRLQITLLTIICFAFLASVVQAQDYEFIVQHEGNARAIGNYQNYTYFTQGGNIHVLENLGDNEFSIVNTFRTNYTSISGITIDSNKMFISVYSKGVLIYDLSDPTHPEFLSESEGLQSAYRTIITDTILIATDIDDASWFNISNLLQPEFMYWNSYDYNHYNAYAINNDILYGFMIASYSGPQYLFGFNIRYPEAPYYPDVYLQICDNWACPTPWYIEAYNDMLFVPQGNSMKIYDIANTDTIIYLTEFTVPNTISHISIENDTAYLTIVDSGVFIYDISDIYQVEQIGNYDETQRFNNVKVYEDHFYCSLGSGGFRIVDKSDFQNFQDVYEFTKTDAVGEICTHNNLGYFVMEEAGLQIVNLTDDLNPVDLGNIGSLSQIRNIKYHQNYLYCTEDPDSTIKIVDVFDSNNPQLVSEIIAEEKSVSDFCIDQDWLYLLDKNETIERYDISIPELPQLSRIFQEEGRALDVSGIFFVMGDLFGDYPYEYKIKLLVGLNAPLQLKDEFILGEAKVYGTEQIIIEYPFIYIRVRSGLVVLKITPDKKLEYCDELLWGASNTISKDMTIKDNYVYLSRIGIKIIDKTDPYNLEITQTIANYFRKIDIRNNHIYCAATTNGYFIYGNDLTAETETKTKESNLDFICSPNPCSNSTTIIFSQNIGTKSKLEIYNLSGKVIFEVEITNEKKIQVNTSDFSSGIYLVKYSSGGNIETKKLVISK